MLAKEQPDFVSLSLPNLEHFDATMQVNDSVKRFSFQAVGNETAEVWQAGYFNDFDRDFHRTFDLHLDAILEAFKAGNAPPVHASAGRRALQLAWAAIESFESGKRVMTPCSGGL